MLLLHRHASPLATFKLLGTTFDLRLRLDHCINAILKKVRPKLKAVLRLKPYYDGPAMVRQFKTHVLGIEEANHPAYYHKGILNSFLRELGMPVEHEWLTTWPRCHCDVTWPCWACSAHVNLASRTFLCNIFSRHVQLHHRYDSRHQAQAHDRPIQSIHAHVRGFYVDRSVHGLVCIYNAPPQHVVDAESVQIFQTRLTRMQKCICEHGRGISLWRHALSPDTQLITLCRLQRLWALVAPLWHPLRCLGYWLLLHPDLN